MSRVSTVDVLSFIIIREDHDFLRYTKIENSTKKVRSEMGTDERNTKQKTNRVCSHL